MSTGAPRWEVQRAARPCGERLEERREQSVTTSTMAGLWGWPLRRSCGRANSLPLGAEGVTQTKPRASRVPGQDRMRVSILASA